MKEPSLENKINTGNPEELISFLEEALKYIKLKRVEMSYSHGDKYIWIGKSICRVMEDMHTVSGFARNLKYWEWLPRENP